MTIHSLCRDYGLPAEVATALEKTGIQELYPPQIEAFSAGALAGESLVIAAPTASGKTLIAEIAMLHVILRRGGRCLYVVPLRALASEKYEDFHSKYSPLGIRVGISTGDFDTADPRLAQNDILIVTNEKADSLLRHRADWLLSGLSLVVLDEAHLLTDLGRGPTLEVLVAKLRLARPDLQLLALSATIRNVDEIAAWLGAKPVASNFRPVPLRAGVYLGGEILFADGSTRPVEAGDDPLTALALDTVREGGQALMFVSTRRSAQAVARRLARPVSELIPEDSAELGRLAERVKGVLPEPTRICQELARCVQNGVAFHHAGLHHAQRRAIEGAFRGRLLRVVCTTTTLAAGVNLPARRVVIRDVRRYVGPTGLGYIPTLEFHQMAGRAGRPGLDPYGEAVLIAKSEDDRDDLFLNYILAPPERITSRLGESGALAAHVLSSIASSYASTMSGITSLFCQTFFAYERGVEDLNVAIGIALEFLIQEGMILPQGERFLATPFGEIVSQLYIDPLSAVILRDGLAKLGKPTELALLHLIAHTPDMEKTHVHRGELDKLEATTTAGEWLFPVPEGGGDYSQFLAEVKTALVLQAWMEEAREGEIYDEFGVGPGDLHRLVEIAEWLLYSGQRIARLFKLPDRAVEKLRSRVRYGVREDLLELVRLRGIGRSRARALHGAGFRHLRDIAAADEEAIARVPHLGPELARSIKSQAQKTVSGA